MDKYGDKLFVWGSDIEPATINQAFRATTLPFIPGPVALMPDAHIGIGATVGSVIPTEGAIVPSFAGVDLGCGVGATETVFTREDLPDNLDALMPLVAKGIPAGVGQGHESERQLKIPGHFTPDEATRARRQFGSLGSGNHFVEVSVDERGTVWTVLHSGSRGIGNLLARKHMDIAKGDMKARFVKLADPDLAYFTEGTPEFGAYIRDMLWSQDYAMGNRLAMNDALQAALRTVIDPHGHLGADPKAHVVQVINCHHNYTAREHHLGRDLWITRKGAIKAGAGDMGIIPGSMGTDSYIVRGLGNASSYNSSSHGAGRKLSRSAAKRELDLDGLRAQMAGKTWNGDASALIDEDPRAYKDIRQVMADQGDLTEVVHELTQVFNYKGTG
jgi:tRNA-splicing ligase RtcB (3'-phosphate/5'-hydroxy nucleic acid ligase)